MELSLFLAKFLGLYLIIVSIGFALNRSFYHRSVDNFLDNSCLILISGIIALLMGLILVLLHNRWTADWTLAITLLAWLILIVGVIRLWIPAQMLEWTRQMRDSKAWPILVAISGLLGLFLGYHGFHDVIKS